MYTIRSDADTHPPHAVGAPTASAASAASTAAGAATGYATCSALRQALTCPVNLLFEIGANRSGVAGWAAI